MKIRKRLIRMLGALVFSIGILAGMVVTGISIWGDFEATRFDSGLSLLRDKSLTTLRCPIMMTTAESATVHAVFENPLDRPITLTVRAHVSRYVTMMRESTDRLPLDPGQTARLEWTVTPDDVVYGHLILVKVLQFRQYPLSSRLGACGIVVVNLPFLSGSQINALAFAASILFILGGIGLWIIGKRPLTTPGRQITRTIGALGGSVLVGMTVSGLGWWMMGLVVLAINILTIGAVIGHLMNSPVNN